MTSKLSQGRDFQEKVIRFLRENRFDVAGVHLREGDRIAGLPLTVAITSSIGNLAHQIDAAQEAVIADAQGRIAACVVRRHGAPAASAYAVFTLAGLCDLLFALAPELIAPTPLLLVAPALRPRVCTQCGQEFQPETPHMQRHCSRTCRQRYARARHTQRRREARSTA